MTADLAGQVAIVTGGARGIGFATAHGIAAAGGVVVMVDRDRAVERAAIDAGALAVVADLADVAAAEQVVDRVVREHGRLDVLVNNAGVARHNPVDRATVSDMDLMWAVNVRATMVLSRDALRHMRLAGRGQILNVVSTAALTGGAGESVYSATKAAVRAFTEALADEARLLGVRVHGVYPAGVDTGFWATATRSGPGVDPATAFLRPDDVAAAILHALTAPEHVHLPELVVRAVADGDAEATRRKLAWFSS